MIYQCQKCGLSKSDGAMGSVLPQCKCDWTASPRKPDYTWATIEDYEKDAGFKVNTAFKMAWTMARTTNDLFKLTQTPHSIGNKDDK